MQAPRTAQIQLDPFSQMFDKSRRVSAADVEELGSHLWAV